MMFIDDLRHCVEASFPKDGEAYYPYAVAGWQIVHDTNGAYHQPLLDCIACLHERYGSQLPGLVATFYFDPQSWSESMLEQGRRRYLQTVMVLSGYLVLYPLPDIATRLESRLIRILANPYEGEQPVRHLSMPPENCYLSPDLEDCLGLLIGLPLTPELLTLIEKLLTGRMDTGTFRLTANDQPHSAYGVYGYRLTQPISELLRHLFLNKQLSYDLFRRTILYMPEVLVTLYQPGKFYTQLDYPAFIALDALRQRLIADIVADLTPDKIGALQKAVDLPIHDPGLRAQIPIGLHGAAYLLHAAEYHVRFGLGKLPHYAPYGPATLENAVSRLAQADQIEPPTLAERGNLIKQLQQFPSGTLKALLPVAPHAQAILFEALGWQEMWQLKDLAQDIVEQARAASERDYGESFPNSANPLVGLVDIAMVRHVVDSLGEQTVRDVFAAWHETHDALGEALFLIEAALGLNRPAVLQGFKRNKQLAIKAFGALPLTGGPEEVLERYLTLRDSGKMAQAQFGATRRVTHAAAIQTALMHLAQVAGYADADSLEWDMEARLANDTALPGRHWQYEKYTLTLTLESSEPGLTVSRDGKVLKSVPAAVRQSAPYHEAKAIVSQWRDQARRIRSILEKLMIHGEPVTLERFANLLQVPIAQQILSGLVLRLEGGQFGIFDPTTRMLRDLVGNLHPIDSSFFIAHAYHLFQAGQLSAWQQLIVHDHLVQPFRQVFRELYLLTPAEEQTQLYSNRFAGHTISANVAARLFGSRSWHLTLRNGYQAYRQYGALRAVFTFPGAHSFWGDEAVLTDQIYFEQQPTFERIPFADVPPLIFSEAMRDADLFVSVAQRDGEVILSTESYEQRRQLVTALLNDIGLAGVTVEGHFAHVQGKLARYRVHLGSAAIHIEPGSYLCIVPTGWGRHHEKLFLPFADDADAKISEVISKILLLLADDQITDETILRQIRAVSP